MYSKFTCFGFNKCLHSQQLIECITGWIINWQWRIVTFFLSIATELSFYGNQSITIAIICPSLLHGNLISHLFVYVRTFFSLGEFWDLFFIWWTLLIVTLLYNHYLWLESFFFLLIQRCRPWSYSWWFIFVFMINFSREPGFWFIYH